MDIAEIAVGILAGSAIGTMVVLVIIAIQHERNR